MISIRTFRCGDIGHIASRQALLYAETQGWGLRLEANVLRTAADFLTRFTPGREQCWVAELDGVLAGSVFLTDEGHKSARLRLLYVEPLAQGRGIGSRLVGSVWALRESLSMER